MIHAKDREIDGWDDLHRYVPSIGEVQGCRVTIYAKISLIIIVEYALRRDEADGKLWDEVLFTADLVDFSVGPEDLVVGDPFSDDVESTCDSCHGTRGGVFGVGTGYHVVKGKGCKR